MESKENKSESGKKPKSKSSAATPDQKSKPKTKETGNDHILKSFVEENKKIHERLETSFKKLAKDNKTMFAKQDRWFERLDQMIEKQDRMIENQDRMMTQQKQSFDDFIKPIRNITGKERDEEQAEKVVKEPQTDNDNYVLFRNAYRNLAQRNTSRENEVKIGVEVGDSYQETLAKLDRTRNITAKN